MNNYNSNFLNTNLDCDQNLWTDGLINNNFNNNQNINLTNLNNSNDFCNLNTFNNLNTINNSQNNLSNHLNNLNNINNQTNLPNLSTNLNNNQLPNNNLDWQKNCNTPNTPNSYYNDYQTGCNSSNSSSITNNEFYDYNQQNQLITNNSNLMQTFDYETLNLDLNKDQNLTINYLSNPNLNIMNNNSISSTISSSSTSNSIINHSSNPSFNSQTHFNQFKSSCFNNSNETSYLVQQDNFQFLPTPTPTPEYQPEYEIFDGKKPDYLLLDEKAKQKRDIMNKRERSRVKKINESYNDLQKTYKMVKGKDAKLTKLDVLEQSYTLINQLEKEVLEKKKNMGIP